MKNLCTIVSVLVCMTFSATAQHKYAVLITGDYAAKEPEIPLANQWNQGQGRGPLGMMEFWNDTYLMWEMLQAKGYSRENIFCAVCQRRRLCFGKSKVPTACGGHSDRCGGDKKKCHKFVHRSSLWHEWGAANYRGRFLVCMDL